MTVGTVSPAKGSTISMGTTAASPSADTFVEIGLVTLMPKVGKEYTANSFKSLKTGAEQFTAGGYSAGGVISIPIAKDKNDSGQSAIVAALGDNLLYNFKITDNDVTATLTTPGFVDFKAKVVGYTTDRGGENANIMGTVMLAVDAASYAETAAAA